MTLYLETADGFVKWTGQRIDSVLYPPNIDELWTAEDLAALGLYAPDIPEVPWYKVITGQRVVRVNGVVTMVYDLVDAPGSVDAQFPPLQPWQFWSIIDLSGIGEQALYDAIDLIPDAQFKVKAKRKLSTPPSNEFRRSDPLFSNPLLMSQLGLTKEVIDALWIQAAQLE